MRVSPDFEFTGIQNGKNAEVGKNAFSGIITNTKNSKFYKIPQNIANVSSNLEQSQIAQSPLVENRFTPFFNLKSAAIIWVTFYVAGFRHEISRPTTFEAPQVRVPFCLKPFWGNKRSSETKLQSSVTKDAQAQFGKGVAWSSPETVNINSNIGNSHCRNANLHCVQNHIFRYFQTCFLVCCQRCPKLSKIIIFYFPIHKPFFLKSWTNFCSQFTFLMIPTSWL